MTLAALLFFQIEAQRAAARFEKASSQHEAAKEMVLLAEEGYIERGMPFDQAWQEMLNHSTTRVSRGPSMPGADPLNNFQRQILLDAEI